MSEEACQRCQEIGKDRRTLWMACLYAMEELNIPFKQVETDRESRHFYTLRVCKACRSSWMQAIQEWFRSPKSIISPGTGIFVRKNGNTVEITEEEWAKAHPDRDPVRVKAIK